MIPRLREDDRGATLIVVLLFAVVFSLIVTGLLTLTGTGVRSAESYSTSGQQRASADGATQAAISAVQSGMPCAGDWTAPSIGGNQSIVRCTGPDSTVAGGTTALQSVGTVAGEHGITSSAKGLRVQGNVYSNSGVTGPLDVTGNVTAVQPCAGVRASGTLSCAGSTGPTATPDLDPPTSVLPPLQSVPACPGRSGWLVTLTPGYYDNADVTALNTLTGGACQGVVVWLRPGIYYADFGFGGARSPRWTVSDKTVAVVGGTPQGWHPTDRTRPAIPLPGGCDPGTDGVQLVLGGTSRLDVGKGHVELCGPPDGTRPAVYGLPRSAPQHTLDADAVLTVSGFANATRALTIDERPTPLTADASLTGTRTAALQVGGFRPDVPVGSVITGAQLLIAHRESGGALKVAVTAAFPGLNRGAGCTLDAGGHGTVPRRTALTTDTVDLTACGLSTPGQLTGFATTLTAASGAGTAVEHLDGIAVRVTYRTPTVFLPTATTTPAADTSGEAAFAHPTNAEHIDGTSATATLTSAHSRGSISLAGYDQPAIPAGATLQAVTLLVAHDETSGVGQPTVTIVPGDGSTACSKTTVPSRARSTQDTVDLRACGITDPAQLAGLTVTYSAALDGGSKGTANLDGIWLRVLYNSPSATRTASAASSRASSTAAAFTDPTNAEQVAEVPAPRTADVTLPAAKATTAAVTLSGFDTAHVPDESELSTATLNITHIETGPLAPTITLAGPDYSGECLSPHAVTGATLNLVTACGLTDPHQLQGLRVTFAVSVPSTSSAPATEHLDGITLSVDYSPTATAPSATVTPVAGTAPFTDPQNAGIIDADAAEVTLPSTGATALTSAGLALSGYATGDVPPGAVLQAATLRVAHVEERSSITPTVTLTSPGYAGPCTKEQRLPAHTARLTTDTIDLVATCRLTTGAALRGLVITYSAGIRAGAAPATERLDGTSLEVTYVPPVSTAPSTAVTPAPHTTQATFSPVDAARVLDRSVATARLSSRAAKGSIQLVGFVPPPEGSTVSHLTLLVGHRDTRDIAAPTVTINVPEVDPTKSPCTETVALHASTALTTESVELPTTCPITDAAQVAGLTATYVARLADGGTAGTDRLDGIALDLIVDAPHLESQSGCAVLGGYPSGSTCAALSSTDGAGRLRVNGSVYTPAAPVDLAMKGLDYTVVTGRIVARTIDLDLTPSSGYAGPLVGPAPKTALSTFTTYAYSVRSPGTATGSGFADDSRARTIDGSTAAAAFTSTTRQASVVLGGWSGTSTGTTVLRVAHQEDGPVTSLAVGVALPADGGRSTITCRLSLPVHRDAGAPVTDQVDLSTACGLPAGRDLTKLQVTVTAAGPAGSAERLDGLQLDLLGDPEVTATVTYTGGHATVTSWRTR